MTDTWLYRYKRVIISGLVLLFTLSMASAMLIVVEKISESLLDESSNNAKQLGTVITSSLRTQMLRRSSEQMQNTLRDIGSSNYISKIFILNSWGQIIFSSDESEIGKKIDKMTDISCRGCHHAINESPSNKTTILHHDGGDVLRNVTVIKNEPPCFGCHSRENSVNGKLIIDHPLSGTYALVKKIRLIIMTIIPIFGAICLLVVIPILSRMLDRYINQIRSKNSEISLVYSIIDRVSRTIDMEELKNIVLDIVSDLLEADEIDIVLPKGEKGYRIITRSTSGDKYQRKKLEPEDVLTAVVERWRDGRLKTHEFSGDRTEVYLPIEKGDARLALIVIRCNRHPFPTEKLKLVEAICSHIAIAFENARLYSIAITDELTDLFTVRHFRLSLDRQMVSFEQYGEKFSLLIIDIDDFKRVNDTYGHPTGDAVLKRVAACIAESVRGDDLAFRYGGEEFTVILPSTALSGALQVAERIRSQIEASDIVVDGRRIVTTASIGLAVCPDNAIMVKNLILEADKSLYVAKHNGKNRTVASENILL
jgi:diguanylate cyclase (GGDEF)-like protein